MPRVDLHLHSKYSDRPSEWILRQLGMPQSYSQPEDLYRKLHAAGMNYKTITDHNRIEGCLALAHYPDVFISEEVTAYFPDGCKIHVLVWNITEEQHAEIQRLRENIYDLVSYFRAHALTHVVTHPLANLNGKLTADHFEKMILLFQGFEERNGHREPLAQELANLCLRSLTPEKMSELANRHGFAPADEQAHVKFFTGGSDDHGGLYVGRTWTETTRGATPHELLAEIRVGAAQAGGCFGEPLHLASSLYSTVFHYAQDKLKKSAPLTSGLLSNVAQRFVAGKNPARFSFGERIGLVVESVRTGQAFDFIKPGETTLAREFATFFADPKVDSALDQIVLTEPDTERRSFRMASYLGNEMSYRLFLQFMQRVQRGNLLDGLQSITGLLPILGAITPYIVAYRQQAPERSLLREVAAGLLPDCPSLLANTKRAWFTDTLEDVNGVARTICAMTTAGCQQGADLTVVTSRPEIHLTGIPLKNFVPIGEFEIPEYKLQKLSFPPFLEIIDWIQREKFTEIIISTPGPIGLCAFAAAKLLNLRVSAIYHTDFPQYARFLSDDQMMETITWSYMQWFYGQCDLVYVNSEFYRRCWQERGLAPERLALLPRGLDTTAFNMAPHRQADYWSKRGTTGPVLLYVGRISKEKELNFLTEVVRALEDRGAIFSVAIVGEGPFREEMEGLLPQAIFTGILRGPELSAAYASADIFVFPSTTDTFGNVVLEAMASGLPAVVSDVGGPKELIREGDHGHVCRARDTQQWADTLEKMLLTPLSLTERAALALSTQQERSWAAAFTSFWNSAEKASGVKTMIDK
jgi:glycosyltransferase involved in cell wall biosynthesis